MAGFNRTLSPQGDGNLETCSTCDGSGRVEFNRTLSPQGDGNPLYKNVLIVIKLVCCSTEPFPRKGTETIKHSSSLANTKVSVQQNPFPARGRKPRNNEAEHKGTSGTVQQNPFPARGRKPWIWARSAPLPSICSTEPFPRKGTET